MASVLTDPQAGAVEPVEPAVRYPLVWLLVILAVAAGVRYWFVHSTLQQEEFPALFAVASREAAPGMTAPAGNPLTPVGSWAEVAERSILPYNVPNPVPLYHWLLYATVQILPIAEWSLRLPSLVAGVLCVLGVYLVCRRAAGPEVALAAALLAAVEPIQVQTASLARPFIFANLAYVFSWLGLLGLLQARSMAAGVVAAVGYGVCVALVGYFSPVVLYGLSAHLGLLAYWWLARPGLPSDRARQLMLLLVGVGVAIIALLPGMGYLTTTTQQAVALSDHWVAWYPPRMASVVRENLLFLLGLVFIPVASYLIAQAVRGQPEEEETQAEGASADGAAVVEKPKPLATPEPPPPPMPERADLVWLARCWLFLPQAVVLFLAIAFQLPLYLTPFIGYTTLGGVVLLACYTARDPYREVRVGTAVALAVGLVAAGFTTYGQGVALLTPAESPFMVNKLDRIEAGGLWQPNDVMLYRPTFPEADLLVSGPADDGQERLRQCLLSPITTLYAPKTARPVVVLTMSDRRGEKEIVGTPAGASFDPGKFYNDVLAEQLRPYERYRLCSTSLSRYPYLRAFLPWLATKTGDLEVARRADVWEKKLKDHYFTVPKNLPSDEEPAGLSDKEGASPNDFDDAILIKRLRPADK